MSNQQQLKAEEPKLSKEEEEEMKALQDVRKIAGEGKGPAITDSQRARLSELQAKAEPPAKEGKAAESKAPAAKK